MCKVSPAWGQNLQALVVEGHETFCCLLLLQPRRDIECFSNWPGCTGRYIWLRRRACLMPDYISNRFVTLSEEYLSLKLIDCNKTLTQMFATLSQLGRQGPKSKSVGCEGIVDVLLFATSATLRGEKECFSNWRQFYLKQHQTGEKSFLEDRTRASWKSGVLWRETEVEREQVKISQTQCNSKVWTKFSCTVFFLLS